MVDVGTPTILTHNNLNKRPAWRIALAKFILAANLPLQRFYNTFTCPNVTLMLQLRNMYFDYMTEGAFDKF